MQHPGTAKEVFLAFLKLGLSSFGGPIAHLAYFRAEFVDRRQWLNDQRYSELLALCQFLPGPASSQVGMMLGLGRAGWFGMLAAWGGFTLPSALALILFAYSVHLNQALALSGWVHGLKVVAVAIVAQAVLGMLKSLCPDRQRVAMAILAGLITSVLVATAGQLLALGVSGLVGWLSLSVRAPAEQGGTYPVSRRVGMAALIAFFALLVALPLAARASGTPTLALIEAVYRSSALVFGGGHVVLPLLQASVVPSGLLSNADFLAGYGAAQAVPGPLFTFSAYLGAIAAGPLQGWVGGLLLLCITFLPAALILVCALPFWEQLRQRAGFHAALAGVNAGVVGILGAALYDPLWRSAIQSSADILLAFVCLVLLTLTRVAPAWVVLFAACWAEFIGSGI